MVGIIGLLVALLMPSVQQAREAARRVQCQNNLRQYGLAIHNYENVFNVFPVGSTGSYTAAPFLGFGVRILPYMDQSNVYNQINWSLVDARDSLMANGQPLMSFTAPYLKCPSDISPDFVTTSEFSGLGPVNESQASYDASIGSMPLASSIQNCNPYSHNSLILQMNPNLTQSQTGNNDFNTDQVTFGDILDIQLLSGIGSRIGSCVSIKDCTDGTSNLIAMGEYIGGCNDSETGWMKANGTGNFHHSIVVPINDMSTCPFAKGGAIRWPDCTTGLQWGISWGYRSLHAGGAQFLFADGSVHFLNQSIDIQTYQYLGGRADGHVIGDF